MGVRGEDRTGSQSNSNFLPYWTSIANCGGEVTVGMDWHRYIEVADEVRRAVHFKTQRQSSQDRSGRPRRIMAAVRDRSQNLATEFMSTSPVNGIAARGTFFSESAYTVSKKRLPALLVQNE